MHKALKSREKCLMSTLNLNQMEWSTAFKTKQKDWMKIGQILAQQKCIAKIFHSLKITIFHCVLGTAVQSCGFVPLLLLPFVQKTHLCGTLQCVPTVNLLMGTLCASWTNTDVWILSWWVVWMKDIFCWIFPPANCQENWKQNPSGQVWNWSMWDSEKWMLPPWKRRKGKRNTALAAVVWNSAFFQRQVH